MSNIKHYLDTFYVIIKSRCEKGLHIKKLLNILWISLCTLGLFGFTNIVHAKSNSHTNNSEIHITYHHIHFNHRNYYKRKSIRANSNTNANHAKTFYISEDKNLHYTSQGNSTACEAASIKNILSIHNIGDNMSLYQLCKNIGWNKHNHGNWNYEYTGNPYTYSEATISPSLEAHTLKYYGIDAFVHNYASKSQIINYLKKGYQLIPEAGRNCSYKLYYHRGHWKQPDHILVIDGIKRNPSGNVYVQYIDSEHGSKHLGVGWCKFNQFWKSYNRPKITGDRLVVAK